MREERHRRGVEREIREAVVAKDVVDAGVGLCKGEVFFRLAMAAFERTRSLLSSPDLTVFVGAAIASVFVRHIR